MSHTARPSILSLVVEDLKDGFGSEDIAIKRDLSRSVVWKAVEYLRDEGELGEIIEEARRRSFLNRHSKAGKRSKQV